MREHHEGGDGGGRMSRHRVRSSKWPYGIAAVILGALAAWALAANTDDLTQVRLPDTTTIVVTKTTTDGPKALVPSTTVQSTSTSTTTASTSPTTTTAANAASQAPVPDLRVASVVVLDGSGRPRAGARSAMRLILTGWATVASDSTQSVATTRVLARAGFEDAARLAIADLGLVAQVEPLTDQIALPHSGDVTVVLGRDLPAP